MVLLDLIAQWMATIESSLPSFAGYAMQQNDCFYDRLRDSSKYPSKRYPDRLNAGNSAWARAWLRPNSRLGWLLPQARHSWWETWFGTKAAENEDMMRPDEVGEVATRGCTYSKYIGMPQRPVDFA